MQATGRINDITEGNRKEAWVNTFYHYKGKTVIERKDSKMTRRDNGGDKKKVRHEFEGARVLK